MLGLSSYPLASFWRKVYDSSLDVLQVKQAILQANKQFAESQTSV